jgi:tRNA(Ile)-lysidine synthetase-like protein
MKVDIKPGKYVIAVSGGVDSVALLHILKGLPGIDLVVAHFDHGIREDSPDDRVFVEALANEYGLPFAYKEGQLGSGASEAAARKVRYDFLRKVQRQHNVQAIITAHHQDDVLETAIINLLRGTSRKGLTSLTAQPGIERPLLNVPKKELIAYAKDQGLKWREDSTNQDQSYLRNYVRHSILPRFDAESRAQFLHVLSTQQVTNLELDKLLDSQLHIQSDETGLDRQWFTSLSHDVAREVLAAWLRANNIRDFDRKTLERLVVAAKVGQPGATFDVLRARTMQVNADTLALNDKER